MEKVIFIIQFCRSIEEEIMIKQTKKKVFALLGIAGLIGILSIPTVAQTPSIP